MNNDLTFLILSTFAVVVCLALMVFMHEQTHKTIYGYAGIDSEITFDFEGGHTTPINDGNKTMPIWASIGQVNTEAFGYQIQSASIGIMMVIIICTIYLGWKIESDKHANN